MDITIVAVYCFKCCSEMTTICDWVDSSRTTWLF